MLRILHAVSYFPPDRMGGVGEVVAHVHRALRAAGHHSRVLTTGTSTDDPTVIRAGRRPGSFGVASARFADLARDADVLHIHHGEGIGLLAAMRARGIRTPVLLTMHVSVVAMRRSLGPYRACGRAFCRDSVGRWLYRKGTMRLRSLLDSAAMALADDMTFISRSAARDVLGDGRAPDARVIYNSVPPDTSGNETAPDTVDLLFVGANTERKRVELLPLILAALKRRRPDATLRIVGFRAIDNPELVQHARDLGVLSSIDFTGPAPSSSLGPYYRSARALIVPSVYEGLPMVILEAMSNGLPVVATRVSGHPEAVEHRVSGLLVPPDDPEAMADAATELLENRELATQLATEGRSVVRQRFSLERQVSAYLDEYERLVRGRRSS